MPKGLQRSLSRAPGASGAGVQVKVYKAEDLAIEIDGATGVGWGTAVIAGLPQGNLLFLGAVSYMQISGPSSAGLVDTWQGDYGIGTTPATDGTITAGDVDIIPSTALAAATAEVSPRTRGVSTTSESGAILDNTDGSLELNLNVLVDDANISADDIACTADGEVHVAFAVLGDD